MMLLQKEGGRVAWYHGEKHELIAFDAIIDDITKNTDLFIMNPDGTGKKNISSRTKIPKGFIGQPSWHPDGKHIILQAEGAYSEHRFYNHMAWGINADLWILSIETGEAEKIFVCQQNHAALHSHFNKYGTKLIFSYRIPTGKLLPPALRRFGPGGENTWDGWCIYTADFNIKAKGLEKLTGVRTFFENKGGFFETHGFTDEGGFIFSYTPDGKAYVDDVYTCDRDGAEIINLINSPSTWEEHGSFSPQGGTLAFISSRFDKSWRAPGSKANTLRTELYLKGRNGDVVQLTDMNKILDADKRYLVSDFDWDKSGKRIVFQVAPAGHSPQESYSPQIWMAVFSLSL